MNKTQAQLIEESNQRQSDRFRKYNDTHSQHAHTPVDGTPPVIEHWEIVEPLLHTNMWDAPTEEEIMKEEAEVQEDLWLSGYYE